MKLLVMVLMNQILVFHFNLELKILAYSKLDYLINYHLLSFFILA